MNKIHIIPTRIAACVVRISNVRCDALTSSPVTSNNTVGVDSTSAWINTLLILTRKSLRTVIIYYTFRFPAYLVWVSKVAWRTDTSCLVCSNLAYCFNPALFINARVLAFLLYACLGEWTLKVTLASG